MSGPGEAAAEPDAGLPAREVALELLQLVLRRKRPLDEALEAHAGLERLEARDRGFARLLVATALRRLGQIDALLAHCLESPLPPRANVIEDVLRLGACQLVFLGTPPHAAVDQSVALTRLAGHPRLRGLVNAVLRRIANEGEAFAAAQDAARVNTPDWLWQSWSRAYGEAGCRAIADVHLAEAPLDLTVAREPEKWAQRLAATVLPTGTLRLAAGGRVRDLPGFDEGAWWVQDAAASLPARLLGNVGGRRVVDLCAAPGGKAAQLLVAGAELVAVDRSAGRIERLRENLQRLGLAAETVVADAGLWRPEAPVDAVLLDAPCTATGSIRRHPDILRLKSPRDVRRLAAVQDRLLRAAVEMLTPGGRLVYCTCSLQPEEGPARITALLNSGAPVARAPVEESEIAGLGQIITADGDLRTLPWQFANQGGLDGFYVARLERRG